MSVTFIAYYASPLGRMTMASDGEAITGLWFDGQKYYADTLKGDTEERELPVFREAARWLDIYFSGKEPDFTPPLCPVGSEFRRLVWAVLLTIPYGSTMSYGEIAAFIAVRTGRKSMSAQAVGGAVGHNPISVIIPCHRVLGADRSLTGYAGGVDKKQALLQLERIEYLK